MSRDYKDNCVVTIGHCELKIFSPRLKTDWFRFLRSRLPQGLFVNGLFEKECRKWFVR